MNVDIPEVWTWLKLATGDALPFALVQVTNGGRTLTATDSYRLHRAEVEEPIAEEGLYLNRELRMPDSEFFALAAINKILEPGKRGGIFAPEDIPSLLDALAGPPYSGEHHGVLPIFKGGLCLNTYYLRQALSGLLAIDDPDGVKVNWHRQRNWSINFLARGNGQIRHAAIMPIAPHSLEPTIHTDISEFLRIEQPAPA